MNSFQTMLPAIYRHKKAILDLDFNYDGKRLASAGDSIFLWDMEPASWVSKVCEVASRNLTRTEWSQYFPNQAYQLTCPQLPAGQ
jgi:WD40 repeat protein